MSTPYALMKEPLEELFQKFAYLELALAPGAGEFPRIETLCAQIRYMDDLGGLIVWSSASFASELAGNFLGKSEIVSDEKFDVIKELANTMAGQVVEILYAGHHPDRIGLPVSISDTVGSALWTSTPPENRFLIRKDEEIVGGIALQLPEVWSGQWA